jgi:hypothetical protein
MATLWFPGPVFLQVGIGRLDSAAGEHFREVEESVEAGVCYKTAVSWWNSLARLILSGKCLAQRHGEEETYAMRPYATE